MTMDEADKNQTRQIRRWKKGASFRDRKHTD